MRRIIAGVVIVIVIVLILIGVSSCQSSSNKSALESYASNVNSLITRSQTDSKQLFTSLHGGVSSTDAVRTQNDINKIAQDAANVLSSARKQSVPSPAKEAQTNLVEALQLRYDGLISIAKQIQPAVGSSVSQSAVSTIAGDMARFYSSDVLYKLYTVPELAAALHGANAVVGPQGVRISNDQFLPSLSWLTPGYISSTLGVSGGSGSSSASSASGPLPHGSKLNSVSFNGSALQTNGNTIAAKPAPTFTLNFSDSGASTEHNVVCKVTVGSVSGQHSVAQLTPGSSTNCVVTLSSPPPAGTATLTATIEKVPGETKLANNTMSFPVTFTG